MTLEKQIKFMEEHAREARFQALDPSFTGDQFLAEDKAEALTGALQSLRQYLDLVRAFQPLTKCSTASTSKVKAVEEE